MVEDGSMHPPVGMSVRVQAQSPDVKITASIAGSFRFLIAPLMPIVSMFLFPTLAWWLLDVLYARQCGVVARARSLARSRLGS